MASTSLTSGASIDTDAGATAVAESVTGCSRKCWPGLIRFGSGTKSEFAAAYACHPPGVRAADAISASVSPSVTT